MLPIQHKLRVFFSPHARKAGTKCVPLRSVFEGISVKLLFVSHSHSPSLNKLFLVDVGEPPPRCESKLLWPFVCLPLPSASGRGLTSLKLTASLSSPNGFCPALPDLECPCWPGFSPPRERS